jgi:hypothetical protein
VLSHYDRLCFESRADWSRELKRSPVRVQWDPERSLRLAEVPYRSLQVGLAGEAVELYVDQWIVGLTEVTGLAREIRGRLDAGEDAAAEALLPAERAYPLPAEVAARLGAAARS